MNSNFSHKYIVLDDERTVALRTLHPEGIVDVADFPICVCDYPNTALGFLEDLLEARRHHGSTAGITAKLEAMPGFRWANEAVVFSGEKMEPDEFGDEWDLSSTQELDHVLPSGFPTGYLLHRE